MTTAKEVEEMCTVCVLYIDDEGNRAHGYGSGASGLEACRDADLHIDKRFGSGHTYTMSDWWAV